VSVSVGVNLFYCYDFGLAFAKKRLKKKRSTSKEELEN